VDLTVSRPLGRVVCLYLAILALELEGKVLMEQSEFLLVCRISTSGS
jgi:chromatin segregation and condensation protein Rec8/ScpA/Scc1 (kleisin family)